MHNPREVERNESDYDKAKEVKVFFETKAGVKSLLDGGVVKIPMIFIHSPENLEKRLSKNGANGALQVPVLDLGGFTSCPREEIVKEIREASETLGGFPNG